MAYMTEKNWAVVHYTYYSERRLKSNMSFEEAKEEAKKLAKLVSNDGLGQSTTILEASMDKKVPFQVKVETMTAEAGWVVDVYAVERTR